MPGAVWEEGGRQSVGTSQDGAQDRHHPGSEEGAVAGPLHKGRAVGSICHSRCPGEGAEKKGALLNSSL